MFSVPSYVCNAWVSRLIRDVQVITDVAKCVTGKCKVKICKKKARGPSAGLSLNRISRKSFRSHLRQPRINRSLRL